MPEESLMLFWWRYLKESTSVGHDGGRTRANGSGVKQSRCSLKQASPSQLHGSHLHPASSHPDKIQEEDSCVHEECPRVTCESGWWSWVLVLTSQSTAQRAALEQRQCLHKSTWVLWGKTVNTRQPSWPAGVDFTGGLVHGSKRKPPSHFGSCPLPLFTLQGFQFVLALPATHTLLFYTCFLLISAQTQMLKYTSQSEFTFLFSSTI